VKEKKKEEEPAPKETASKKKGAQLTKVKIAQETPAKKGKQEKEKETQKKDQQKKGSSKKEVEKKVEKKIEKKVKVVLEEPTEQQKTVEKPRIRDINIHETQEHQQAESTHTQKAHHDPLEL